MLGALGPNQKPKVIVMKSTVPVGTTLSVRDRPGAVGPTIPFKVADNPGVRRKCGDRGFHEARPRGRGHRGGPWARRSGSCMTQFVRNGHPIYLMDVPSAEMVKYRANNFLATKISFIRHEMANLCEAYGVDTNRARGCKPE